MSKSRGLTLIEILVAIFILSLIAGSLLTSYGFSFRHNHEAELLLKASFIAQTKMEELQSMDVLSAINAGKGQREQDASGFYVQILCQPYISDDYHLFSVVLKDGTGESPLDMMYAVPPGGKDVLLVEDVREDAVLNLFLAGTSYSMGVQGSGQPAIDGFLADDGKKIMVFINAVEYSGNHRMTFNVNPGGRAIDVKVYDTSRNSNTLTVSGVNEQRLSNFKYRNYSMIRALVRVFAEENDAQPKAVIESILRLKN